jgi:hypothetical protein
MHDNPPSSDDDTDIDRQIRIARMKDELDQIAGGEMFTGGFGPVSSALEEMFLEQALAFERAEFDTDFNRLARRGVIMVPPAELDDAAITDKLWKIFHELARMRCFLYDTDHLSDRELYDWLWRSGLREETADRAGMPDAAWHSSPIGAGNDEDTSIWLRFYASSDERDRWRRNFPDEAIPEHAAPPFDRDRHLPARALL